MAAVVEMGVTDDDRVDRSWFDREVGPVLLAQLARPLEEPAIDEDPVTVVLDQELAAGDGSGSTEWDEGGRNGADDRLLCSSGWVLEITLPPPAKCSQGPSSRSPDP
jgi:hypothetical protein